MEHWAKIVFALGFIQVLCAASVDKPFEPMVAFICDRPAMHRGVKGWIADKTMDCLERMEDILAYCQTMYPDHNITNVVEASELVTINNWPMYNAQRVHPHQVRPFRCLVGGFQSDALLVPQHCEFDHRHDQTKCEKFSHWQVVGEEACAKKDMHLESFGMLLNCKLGMFSGVEYVCCPNHAADTQFHAPQKDDKPDNWESNSAEDDDEEDKSEEEDSEEVDSVTTSQEADENQMDYYEAYLRQKQFPARFDNEHKRFLAAKKSMKNNQQRKTTKLLQDWQAAREHVAEVRTADPKRAEQMAEDIARRYQNLYASYQQEDEAEKQQLLALHQQNIQTSLNERKRNAMDKYTHALEGADIEKILKTLEGYVKAEEKDRMHTVNHFEHVKYSNAREALRIHPFIVNHLKLSEQRIDQALEMLTRYPEAEVRIRPRIEEFLHRFDAIANSIRNVVLPVPEVEEETKAPTSSVSDSSNADDSSDDIQIDDSRDFDVSHEVDEDGDDVRENEHDYEKEFHAHAQDGSLKVSENKAVGMSVETSALGSTLGIALGGVSVFVIIVVAIVMVRRNNRRQFSSPTTGYTEVDPNATADDRHLANMQMNGYENPTYRYFEVQSNPNA